MRDFLKVSKKKVRKVIMKKACFICKKEAKIYSKDLCKKCYNDNWNFWRNQLWTKAPPELLIARVMRHG